MRVPICLRVITAVLAFFGAPVVLAQSAPAQESTTGRSFRWSDAYISARYIYVDNRGGRVRWSDVQYKVHLKGRWQFRAKERTYLQFRAETGSSFQPGWNFSGWGRNAANRSFSVKDLFIGHRIGQRWELQAGGIEFDRGAGTEITWADEDGFQVGYRLSYRPERRHWPDRLQFTVSRIDEFQHPSVFARLPGMIEPNAMELLAQKQLWERVEVSTQFDRISGVNFTRTAIRWKPQRLLDRITLEAVVRASNNPSAGYGLQLARTWKRGGPWQMAFTYSHMEAGVFANSPRRLLLNGDQPALGQRLAIHASRPLGKRLTLATFVSRQLDRTPSIPPHTRWRAQAVVTYRFTNWLNNFPRRGSSEKGGL